MRKFWLKVIAFIMRTFVTDCPCCYRSFFGFQQYGEQIKIGEVNYRIVCPTCAKQITG